jgi:hypothetical protein
MINYKQIVPEALTAMVMKGHNIFWDVIPNEQVFFFWNPILFASCIYIQQIGVRIGCYGLGRGTQ